MQAVNNARLNTNAFDESTILHESHSSCSFIPATSHQLKPTNYLRDMEMPRQCLICGCPTNCYHYDVPSCTGCKAFFRRSLLTSRTYACKHNAMCSKINGINRCRACRFDRCILLGMNPRAMRLPTSIDVAKLSEKVSNRRMDPVFEGTIEQKIIQSLVYVELKVRQIRESSRWQSDSVMSLSIGEMLESSHKNVLADADQYPKEQKWPFTRPLDILQALFLDKRRPHWLMLDTFLSIEVARTMPVFSQLDYNDQVALLKQVIVANAILLQAFYSYQMKSETVIMPNGFSPTKIPKVAGENGLSEITEKMKLISCRAMVPMSRIQMTMEEFVLLKAIIYSHSAIHGLSQRGKVLLERESIRYSKILMKHLQSLMGAAPGAKKYAEIISLVYCLFYAAQLQREVCIYGAAVMRPAVCCPPYMETIMFA
ncbi:zinc finger, c4 type (two domains) domain-containing protein [Ditylenchus destructor]|nr:zinc finger, c4 type (two domains) domain-containing protein [Ditylenchus destructor]